MSRTNAAETDYLTLLFNNTDWANIGDAGGLQNSAAAGNFHVSLHTADPGETGNQATNEATVTGYSRQAVARTAGGWTITTNTADNTAAITFGPATVGSETITHVGVGTDSAGAGNLIWSGALDTSRLFNVGVTLSFAIGALNVTAD